MKYHPKVHAVTCIFFCLLASVWGQANQKRNRGETFYNILNSNTIGHGNIWTSISEVGYVWDDKPIRMDTTKG